MKRAIVVVSLVLLAGPVGAGVVFEVETKDHEHSPPTSADITIQSDGKNIKFDLVAGGGSTTDGEVIFQGDRAIFVDHGGKSYVVIDKEALGAIAGQVKGAMSQVEKMLENLPEEQRRLIQERGGFPGMPKAAKRPTTEIRKTGDRGNRNGYPCVRYEVWRHDKKVREIWTTDWDNIEGGSEVVGAFENMVDFFREMMDSIPNFGGDGGPDTTFGDMNFENGFPVQTTGFEDDGSLESESNLRSAKRRTLDPDAFEPPSGYKRQEMFAFTP